MTLFGFMKRYAWPYLQKYWKRFVSGLVLAVLFGILNGLVVWSVKLVLDRFGGNPIPMATLPTQIGPMQELFVSVQNWVSQNIDPWLPLIGRSMDYRQIVGGIAFLAIFAALRGGVGYASSYCLSWASERVMNDMKFEALVKMNSLSMDYFNRETLGNMLTRINQDTGVVQRYLSLGLSDLVKEPITILSVIVTLFYIDAQLTLFAFIFIPVSVLPMVILGRKIRKATKQGGEVGIQQLSVLIESLSNVRVSKAFGLEKLQENEFRDYAARCLSFSFRSLKAKELINPILETLGALSVGMMITYAIYAERSLAQLGTVIVAFITLQTPIKKLAGINVLLQQTRFAMDRLHQFFSEEPSVKEKPSASTLLEFKKEIKFERVSFTYGDGSVLDEVDFTLPRGRRIGLAGESGCGKSTLLNLLMRFYDVSGGRITIDGQDIREVTFQSLRSQMALVTQETFLFNRTVAENIGFGRIGATRQEIQQAATMAHAHEFIMNLPKGYDTDIGEKGVRLSGGQRQRLTIARAFVRNAPILILDEATASLDSESEAEVQSAIDLLSKDRTVLCVAHRLSTLAGMDEIIVLSKGRIIERGGFETLLSQGGFFAEMARRQGISR